MKRSLDVARDGEPVEPLAAFEMIVIDSRWGMGYLTDNKNGYCGLAE